MALTYTVRDCKFKIEYDSFFDCRKEHRERYMQIVVIVPINCSRTKLKRVLKTSTLLINNSKETLADFTN